jgi:hypothetical protein
MRKRRRFTLAMNRLQNRSIACRDCTITPKEHEDINQSMGLKKQISLLTDTTDRGVQNKDIVSFLNRIVDNFYSETAKSIAQECVFLYNSTKQRVHVQSFLYIAYDIEQQYMALYRDRVVLERLTNPSSFEYIPFSDLFLLDRNQENKLKRMLLALPYKQYLHTPYWRAIRWEKLRRCGKACEQCGSNKELNVHHFDYAYVGEDHLHMDNLAVYCEQCHLLWHMRFDAVGQSGAKEKSGIHSALSFARPQIQPQADQIIQLTVQQKLYHYGASYNNTWTYTFA